MGASGHSQLETRPQNSETKALHRTHDDPGHVIWGPCNHGDKEFFGLGAHDEATHREQNKALQAKPVVTDPNNSIEKFRVEPCRIASPSKRPARDCSLQGS